MSETIQDAIGREGAEGQKISSADTSQSQVAGGFRKVEWESGSINLDYGGGKYDHATEYLSGLGVVNHVYDPYNRSEDHNKRSLRCKPDTITCFNVLNVIQEDFVIDIILEVFKGFKVPVYITTYEGNRSGQGKETTKGYQRHQKLTSYIPMISKHFTISRKGNLLTCIPIV